jgi:hypothetical protein
MFSLIITIISIALVTALALATIYYGGSAFRQGGDAAAAAKLINEGQQLAGAASVAETNGVTVSAVTSLTAAQPDGTVYLASAPAGWDDAVTAKTFVNDTGVTAAICTKVNEKAGIKAANTADAADTDAALVVAAGDITNYGCVTGATPAMNFKY